MSKLRFFIVSMFMLSVSHIAYSQLGCTDELACNYDPNAISEDGTCSYYIDCAGICGGNFVLDGCGNCYDPNGQGEEFSLNFNYTGAAQSFIVPDGVNSVHIEARGASGWTGSNQGGQGGITSGDLGVNPGDELFIYVGGQGLISNVAYSPMGGGWNGGGNGQSNGGGSVGGGGGASDVRLVYNANPMDLTSLNSRVLVAGGGGGSTNNGGAYGGNGGGLSGQNGGQHAGYHYGRGGTQVAGGDNGGAFGQGGQAQNWMTPWNGGGGGGWYGGGVSTAHSGGGGGSSYTGGVLNGSMQQGGNTGNGLVTITYSVPAIPECLVGCMDPNACNFDPGAEIDNASCTYPNGCTSHEACNYDPDATCDDGSCTYPGCNDQAACNFDPAAGCDNGSCAYILDCAGICGGTSIQDACGNCYDPNVLVAPGSQQFNYTGAAQSFIVPNGVNQIHIEAYGASGWTGSNQGGQGGSASGDLSVSPGDELYIYVGGQGLIANLAYTPMGGGWNGGGNGQSNSGGSVGGGGGASDVRLVYNANPMDLTSLNSRVLVAGGGGGSTNNGGAYGGNGGGLSGQDGGQHAGYHYGRGGTQIAGGDNGGAFGQGGHAQNWMTPWNGGGGGGWYGGGVSTAHSGGGGGSSYTGGVLNGSIQQGGNVGNGYVIFSWEGFVVPECLAGCIDPNACNYDPDAEVDDNSCNYPDGCNDITACNYDPGATCDDGSCTYPGCMDIAACNYDAAAGCENNSCIYIQDCAGVCGGNWILDDCGNCYDPNLGGGEIQVTFNYTGAPQTFTVPAGVTSVHIEARGASGWTGSNQGGQGGISSGDLSVTPGDELYIYVGAQGLIANLAYTPMGGGWNGGGNGQSNSGGSVGGGGGASDVRLVYNANPMDLTSLNSRVLVAGGGGGSTNNGGAYGGNGGGLSGQNGGQHAGYHYGRGGTQVAGGDNGGAFGQGGHAQNWMTPWNGGGGGGWYGGGVSTAHSGGGGGSSYTGGVANGSMQQGGNTGNGLVIITYTETLIPECDPGCTDPIACNYDPGAEFNDGSCTYPDGCTDPEACNYDPAATCNDGSCTYPGCNDLAACNYNEMAGCDNGSCIYVIDCAGVCGGNWVADNCGNCYDPEVQGGDFTATFEYTSVPQTFTVPAGVTSVHIEARGASGWTGSNQGGQGGITSGDLNVNPGDQLYIYVGGQGLISSLAYTPMGGGWNGGGDGQANSGGNVGGGGGASDVRLVYSADPLNLASLNSRVIVAGGGGGSTNNSNAFGGNGGGINGQNGGQHAGYHDGRGGTQIAGGDSGGAFGQGGDAQTWMTPWNGGGGGGWYGGGVSTAHSGGGGGSSYTGGVANGSMQQGGNVGNGLVIITYSLPLIPECDPGCNNPSACNYVPEADYDDGTCILPDGCLDPNACNYNALALCDDGSCVYPDGCTDPLACNFDPNALCDNGTCLLPDGCTDALACNYNPMALCDDSSCLYSDPFLDCNGNCLHDCDGDLICDELEISGCTYPAAMNFNPAATDDDGSCDFAAITGCTDPTACNYHPDAQVDNGSCLLPGSPCNDGDENTYNDILDANCNCSGHHLMGCTDPDADNYQSLATMDDGSCVYHCREDINQDGLVNTSDLLDLLASYGQNCP